MANSLNITNLSRRAALTGAMAALSTVPAIAAAAVPGAGNPDAELMALCRHWREVASRYFAAVDHASAIDGTNDDEAYEEASDIATSHLEDLGPITDQITAIPARSLAGIRAKADLIAAFDDPDFGSYITRVLGQSLVEDLLHL